MSLIEDIDYIDADVAYLLGLITARGKISESGGIRQIHIEFPYRSLKVDGVAGTFNTNTSAHLSQLLGYSRIAQPLYSFLISPVGFSSALVSLLQEYQRRDVLEYHWESGKMPRQIIVAEWDITACNLNRHTMIGGIGL